MSYKYNGKIMYCLDRDLGIGDRNSNNGHYVYVRRTTKKDMYDVHTINSIDSKKRDEKHTIPFTSDKEGNIRYIDPKKIRAIRNGNLHPIPISDANFPAWSGISKKPIRGIHSSKIIPARPKIRMKRKHKLIIAKK